MNAGDVLWIPPNWHHEVVTEAGHYISKGNTIATYWVAWCMPRHHVMPTLARIAIVGKEFCSHTRNFMPRPSRSGDRSPTAPLTDTLVAYTLTSPGRHRVCRRRVCRHRARRPLVIPGRPQLLPGTYLATHPSENSSSRRAFTKRNPPRPCIALRTHSNDTHPKRPRA